MTPISVHVCSWWLCSSALHQELLAKNQIPPFNTLYSQSVCHSPSTPPGSPGSPVSPFSSFVSVTVFLSLSPSPASVFPTRLPSLLCLLLSLYASWHTYFHLIQPLSPPYPPLNRPFPPPHSSFLLRLFTPHYWLPSHDHLPSGKHALRLLICGVTLMLSLPTPPPPRFFARIRPVVLSFPPPRRPLQALVHPKMTSPKSVVLTTVHVAPAQAALQAT